MYCAMISIPVVHQICLVRFGFPPFGFIAVKGVIVWSKTTFRFFFRIALIFLATEKLFSISVIPAIKKKEINRKLSPIKADNPTIRSTCR